MSSLALRSRSGRRTLGSLPLALLLACLAGCHRDMHDQPRYGVMEPSDFFADGQSARHLPQGTIARGQLNEDEAFYTGKSEGKFVAEIPLEADRALLERGQERFNIYCAMCHGPTGVGDGMIVQRGFRRPPSLHLERARLDEVQP